MKRYFVVILSVVGWFAVIAQFILMIQSRTNSISDTLIRFFSFFTILTNILVASYFTLHIFYDSNILTYLNKAGTLTAITVYIFMVGTVYQIALRHLWTPGGLQNIVDELLHSFVPILVIIFWVFYENKREIRYAQIPKWSVFPISYLICILIRGHFTGIYPYPFVNVNEIGMPEALINSLILLLIFLCIATLFVFIGKSFSKRNAARAIDQKL
jgi:hypothetical protein